MNQLFTEINAKRNNGKDKNGIKLSKTLNRGVISRLSVALSIRQRCPENRMPKLIFLDQGITTDVTATHCVRYIPESPIQAVPIEIIFSFFEMSRNTVMTDSCSMREDEKPPYDSIPDSLNRRNSERTQENVSKSGLEGRKFVEEPGETDPLEYSREGTDPGLVVIFNHENFKSDKYDKRSGTFKDVEELVVTLGRLKFNIDEKFIFTDLTRKQVLEKITEICQMDLKDRNCLICIFLSHGAKDNRLATMDGHVEVEEIYEPFSKCDDLNNKPKFFLFQACKADDTIQSQELSNVDSTKYDREIVCERTLTKEIPVDVLLVYSTIEGEVSFRDVKYGSWFIQELCRNFTAYGRRDDVISMVIRTAKCVSTVYCYEQEKIRAKQMPIFVSTLTSKFYLTKSKERLNLLKIMKSIEQIKNDLDNLKNTVENLTIPEGV